MEHEQVAFCHDSETGLRSIIAIHSTALGPALGGVRMRPYAAMADALEDCLRLARGMTYKAAAAGLELGGGKSVIIGDPEQRQVRGAAPGSRPLHRIARRALHPRHRPRHLAGRPARDGPGDARGRRRGRRPLADNRGRGLRCRPGVRGARLRLTVVGGARRGYPGSGPSRRAAGRAGRRRRGRAGGRRRPGRPSASGRRSPLGSPGRAWRDPRAAVRHPRALRRRRRDQRRDDPSLRCRILVGGANNVLAAPEHGERLHELGVLYGPDFVANSGGIIFSRKSAGERRPSRSIGGSARSATPCARCCNEPSARGSHRRGPPTRSPRSAWPRPTRACRGS